MQRHQADTPASHRNLIGVIHQRDSFEEFAETARTMLAVEGACRRQQLRDVLTPRRSVDHRLQMSLEAAVRDNLIENRTYAQGFGAYRQLAQPTIELTRLLGDS